MTWTDDLPMMTELPALFEPTEAELPAARIGYHVARAGFGTWAANYVRNPAADCRYLAFRAWKTDPTGQADFLDTAAAAIVAIIRAWGQVLPSDWTVTTPPQGASEGGPYPAGILGREVATRLDLDYQTCLQRTASKRRHHPMASLEQEPYAVAVIPPAAVLLVDDFVSSGRTLTLARQSLAAAGVPSFSFAWGCD
jgi:hypothetical protein